MVGYSPASSNEAKVNLDEVTIDMSSRSQRRFDISCNVKFMIKSLQKSLGQLFARVALIVLCSFVFHVLM